jgi:phage terminase large subunit-like protein
MGVELMQSYSKLSLSTKDFRAQVYNKKVIHNGDPVLSWAIYNAVTRAGPSENLMLDKSKSKERIDPIAALINAHAMAMIGKKESIYNERGLRSLT